MTVIFEEKVSIEVFPTNLDEVELAIFHSPDKIASAYVIKGSLQKSKNIQEATSNIYREGFKAYTPSGIEKLKKRVPTYQMEEDVDWFVDESKDISLKQLYRDTSGQDGFVWQFGNDIPANIELYWSICESSHNLSPELKTQIESHPWMEFSRDVYYIPHNGETWDIAINLPDEEFEKLFKSVLKTTEEKDRAIYTDKLVEALVYEWVGYEDILGVQQLRKSEKAGY